MSERRSLDHFQAEVDTWQRAVTPPTENTPKKEFTRSLEEVSELSEAVDCFDGSKTAKKEIGEEATDVIIRMLGIIAIVGGNATELLDDKIRTMQRKYPADIIRRQVQSGVPYDQAMRQHKEAWNGNGARVIPLFKA